MTEETQGHRPAVLLGLGTFFMQADLRHLHPNLCVNSLEGVSTVAPSTGVFWNLVSKAWGLRESITFMAFCRASSCAGTL